MRSAFLALLFGCSPADPMAARAKHAALACYGNGTPETLDSEDPND